MPLFSHPHPCNFRLTRSLDRGWGEMAFEYQWDSSSGLKDSESLACPDLEHCSLYEYTSYADNIGRHENGFYFPPSPPFSGWKFRDPTDGRTAPVALGCFPATQGWAWDRHKIAGPLRIPQCHSDQYPRCYTFTATQQYRFHCSLCAHDYDLSEPHKITRSFELRCNAQDNNPIRGGFPPIESVCMLSFEWRYILKKHTQIAYMDVNQYGYIDDSAHLGFGPENPLAQDGI